MQVTIHGSQQEVPFIVEASRFGVPSRGIHCVSLDIRQPGESITDGLRFILRDAAQLRTLILALVDECERVQKEEREDFDRALIAKVNEVLDRKVRERFAPAPSAAGFFGDSEDDAPAAKGDESANEVQE